MMKCQTAARVRMQDEEDKERRLHVQTKFQKVGKKLVV